MRPSVGLAMTEDYGRSLIACHSRRLVVRVDVGYLIQAQHQVAVDDGYVHQRVLNLQRYVDSVFEHLVGAIWCLRQGRTRGYHFHLNYFFSGSRRQKRLAPGLDCGRGQRPWLDAAMTKVSAPSASRCFFLQGTEAYECKIPLERGA